MEKITSADQFDQLTSSGVALVDFYADWCQPCRMLIPVLEELSNDLAGKVTVIKVNVDEHRGLAESFSVSSIPALFIIVDGEVRANIVGYRTKQALIDELKKFL